MAGTIRSGGPARFPHMTLNSDGRPHPWINAAAVFTVVLGLLSFALGLFIRTDASSGLGAAVLTAVTGAAALLVGLLAQMVSATREQRVVLVTGMVAAFVGLALGLAHGGFAG